MQPNSNFQINQNEARIQQDQQSPQSQQNPHDTLQQSIQIRLAQLNQFTPEQLDNICIRSSFAVPSPSNACFAVKLILGIKQGTPVQSIIRVPESVFMHPSVNSKLIFDAMQSEQQVARLIPDEKVAGSNKFAVDVLNTITGNGLVQLFYQLVEHSKKETQEYRELIKEDTEDVFQIQPEFQEAFSQVQASTTNQMHSSKSKSNVSAFLTQTQKQRSLQIRSEMQDVPDEQQFKLRQLIRKLVPRQPIVIPVLKMESVRFRNNGFKFRFLLFVTEKLNSIPLCQVHELVRLRDDFASEFLTKNVKTIKLAHYTSFLPVSTALKMRLQLVNEVGLIYRPTYKVVSFDNQVDTQALSDLQKYRRNIISSLPGTSDRINFFPDAKSQDLNYSQMTSQCTSCHEHYRLQDMVVLSCFHVSCKRCTLALVAQGQSPLYCLAHREIAQKFIRGPDDVPDNPRSISVSQLDPQANQHGRSQILPVRVIQVVAAQVQRGNRSDSLGSSVRLLAEETLLEENHARFRESSHLASDLAPLNFVRHPVSESAIPDAVVQRSANSNSMTTVTNALHAIALQSASQVPQRHTSDVSYSEYFNHISQASGEQG